MNEAHFFLLFLYIFYLHNLNIEGKLRSVANPKSEHRSEIIKNLNKENDPVEQVVDLLENLAVETFVSEKDEVVSIGSSVPEFSCKLCEATYKRVGNLKLHMKNKHPEFSVENEASAQSQCKVCGSMFAKETDLQKHLSNHFRCNVCDIPFEDMKYLNRHIKVHHTPICCVVCSKECSDKEMYEQHMKEHLKCDICGKEFDKQHKLNRHIKTHK